MANTAWIRREMSTGYASGFLPEGSMSGLAESIHLRSEDPPHPTLSLGVRHLFLLSLLFTSECNIPAITSPEVHTTAL